MTTKKQFSTISASELELGDRFQLSRRSVVFQTVGYWGSKVLYKADTELHPKQLSSNTKVIFIRNANNNGTTNP